MIRHVVYNSVLDEDDVQVLEFMNPHRGELTGSSNKNPSVEDYPPEGQ